MEGAIKFFKAKLKINEDIPGAPDGVYTWILKEGGLVICPVESNQEIGSIHANLWTWTPTLGRILAAGELEKQGDTILYNLKSGSFMKTNLRNQAYQNLFRSRVDSKLRELGLNPIFLICTPSSNCRQGYETLSGRSIISERNFITPISLVFFYRQFFKEKADDNSNSFYSNHSNELSELKEGGYSGKKATTRRKSKKSRKSRSKTLSKSRKYR